MGFQSLPDALSNSTNTPFKGEVLLRMWLALKTAISKEELDGASDEHANIAMANGFTRFYPHHTPRWTVFYKIKNRMFQKINHKHVVEML